MRMSSCKVAMLAAVLSLACNMPSHAKKITEDLPRFDQVSATLYRGGQPTERGIQQLKQQGIKTVINLRDVDEGNEALSVRQNGMNYVSIPMDGVSKPTDSQIRKFLAVTQDPQAQPVYVHCKYGRDRTGCMVGIYREVADHWTADQAYKEMINHGFRNAFPWLSDAVFDQADKMNGYPVRRPLTVKLFNSMEGALGFNKPQAPRDQ